MVGAISQYKRKRKTIKQSNYFREEKLLSQENRACDICCEHENIPRVYLTLEAL